MTGAAGSCQRERAWRGGGSRSCTKRWGRALQGDGGPGALARDSGGPGTLARNGWGPGTLARSGRGLDEEQLMVLAASDTSDLQRMVRIWLPQSSVQFSCGTCIFGTVFPILDS